MSLRLLIKTVLPALLLAELFFPTNMHAGSVDTPVVAIAAPAVSESSLSRATLRAIFGMRLQKWPDGTPVKVFVYRDESPEHVIFSKEVLQVFPHQLRQSWDKLVYSGLGQYPKQVASPQEMLVKVAATPGAIGYIRVNEVNQNVHLVQVR